MRDSVSAPETDQYVAVRCGWEFILGLRANGTLKVWGTDGQDMVKLIPSEATNIAAIATGTSHCLALRSNGTVLAWGYNTDGRTSVPVGLNNVMAITAGSYHSVALKSNGTLVVWGAPTQTNVPPSLTNVVRIAAGRAHTLALCSDGRLVAWGESNEGQTNVPPGLSNVVEIASGGGHSVVLHGNGTVTSWGSYYWGDTTGTPPAAATNVVAIACGSAHTLALRNDGTIVAWGAGLPGYYTFPCYEQCIMPKGLCAVRAVAAGGYQSVALYEGIPRPFKLSEPSWLSNGSFRFRCEGEPGRLYHFETSDNLLNWNSVGVFAPASSIFYVTNQSAHLGIKSFYRLATE
jgi:alpha-tubulin suppressor-like RCC1 family protein